MKSLIQYMHKDDFENRCGSIIFSLDESSLALLNETDRHFVLENNRKVWSDKDGNPLEMGDHAVQRLDRPVEKGGDGEHISQQEIIDMFIYSWQDIMDMYYNGDLDTSECDAFVIQCKCYLQKKNGKLTCVGARPEDKFLWAVFFIQENMKTGKLDVIIKTLFRGERLNHSHKQERIVIANSGFVKQKTPQYNYN